MLESVLYQMTGLNLVRGVFGFGVVLSFAIAQAEPTGAIWARHAIDNTSKGADGIRLGDVNRDGLPDMVTGWEEGGVVRLYIHPGVEAVKQPWPQVTVGQVKSPEDAVFVDIDNNGVLDVVSACEGRTRSLFVHWAPSAASDLMDAKAWHTVPIPAAEKKMMWMFTMPFEVGDQRILVAGGKDKQAELGWFVLPESERDLQTLKWHTIKRVGWIMSIQAYDMDADGDLDILFSDRKGDEAGCYWLEQPSDQNRRLDQWPRHPIMTGKREYLFLTVGDIDADGRVDVACALKDFALVHSEATDTSASQWNETTIAYSPSIGPAKGVAFGDMNGHGAQDIVVTGEHSTDLYSPVYFVRGDQGLWRPRHIGGTVGTKFDRIELIDLDQDGDLDVVTCEEIENLGVIWYENPIAKP